MPTYQDSRGRIIGADLPHNFPTGAFAATSSGNGSTYDSGVAHTLRLLFNMLSLSGGTTPSVAPRVETSHDAATWRAVTPSGGEAAPSFTTLTSARRCYVGLDRFWRIAWTTTGGPTTATFNVTGDMVG